MSFNCKRFSLALAAVMLGYAPAGAAIIAAAFAQTTQPQVTPPAVPPGSPRPNQTIPEKQKPPPSSDTSGADSSLSDRLEKSDGVVKPPANTDRGIVKPAPDSGTTNTPIIPPPGSPGGRQDVTPK